MTTFERNKARWQAEERAANASADQKKLLNECQFYATDLEKKLADLEMEACEVLKRKIIDLEATANNATRAKENLPRKTRV